MRPSACGLGSVHHVACFHLVTALLCALLLHQESMTEPFSDGDGSARCMLVMHDGCSNTMHACEDSSMHVARGREPCGRSVRACAGRLWCVLETNASVMHAVVFEVDAAIVLELHSSNERSRCRLRARSGGILVMKRMDWRVRCMQAASTVRISRRSMHHRREQRMVGADRVERLGR